MSKKKTIKGDAKRRITNGSTRLRSAVTPLAHAGSMRWVKARVAPVTLRACPFRAKPSARARWLSTRYTDGKNRIKTNRKRRKAFIPPWFGASKNSTRQSRAGKLNFEDMEKPMKKIKKD